MPVRDVVEAIDLHRDDRADAGTHHDVARPVRVRIEPRHSHHRGTTEHHRRDVPRGAGLPVVGLERHERGESERCGCMPRRERGAGMATEATAEPEVIGIAYACGTGALSPHDSLEDRGHAGAHQNRLRRVQPEIGNVLEVSQSPDAVRGESRNHDAFASDVVERARDVRGGPVVLRGRLPDLSCNVCIERSNERHTCDERTDHEWISGCEEPKMRAAVGRRHGDRRRFLRPRQHRRSGDGGTKHEPAHAANENAHATTCRATGRRKSRPRMATSSVGTR